MGVAEGYDTKQFEDMNMFCESINSNSLMYNLSLRDSALTDMDTWLNNLDVSLDLREEIYNCFLSYENEIREPG